MDETLHCTCRHGFGICVSAPFSLLPLLLQVDSETGYLRVVSTSRQPAVVDFNATISSCQNQAVAYFVDQVRWVEGHVSRHNTQTKLANWVDWIPRYSRKEHQPQHCTHAPLALLHRCPSLTLPGCQAEPQRDHVLTLPCSNADIGPPAGVRRLQQLCTGTAATGRHELPSGVYRRCTFKLIFSRQSVGPLQE